MVTKITFLEESSAERQRLIYTDEELKEQIRQHLPKPPANIQGRFKDYIIRHSHVYQALRNASELRQLAFKLGLADAPPRPGTPKAAEVFYSSDDHPWLREAWKLHLDNLRRLKKTADEQNSQLLFILIPSREQVYDFLRPPGDRLDWEYPKRRLEEFFKKEGIHFLDLLPEFRKVANLQPRAALDAVKDLYWRYDYHLNVKGNRLAGILIGRHLLQQSMFDVLDRQRRLSDIEQLLNALTGAPMPLPS